MTTNKPVKDIQLVDAETGELIALTWGPVDAPEFKGWLLRQRTAYKRRTGRKIRVEKING